MKKLIGLSLLLVSGMFLTSSAEAKSTGNNLTANVTANNTLAPQFQRRRYNQRRVRVTTTTRNVRRGRYVYRETYRTTYRPNGRVVTRLISRVVIRRY